MIREATFSIDVPDLRAGIEFYTEGLAFDAIGPASDDSYTLRAGDVRIDLLERDPDQPPVRGVETRNYDRHWTPVHLDLVITDINTAIRAVTAFGGSVESEPKALDDEVLARCADPFGNGFCLIEAAD